MRKLVLASASPRRKELLENLSVPFEICVSDVDEKLPKDIPAELLVKELALLKGSAVLDQYLKKGVSNALVVAADTLVTLDSVILGKPNHPQEAVAMLRSLSGRSHEVISGICVLDSTLAVAKYQETKVMFKALTQEEIERYASTKEPYDKAGAYGIQGSALSFIQELEGDYYNVVGLPMKLLTDILYEEFHLDTNNWENFKIG